MGMTNNIFFMQLSIGKMDNFSYIFADSVTHEAILVDPGFDFEKIITALNDNNLKLKHILLTHHHFDHVSQAEKLRETTSAKLCCHPITEKLLKLRAPCDISVNDGDVLFKGTPLETICIHTPGHAPGSLCFVINNQYLVTGDTLFIGDCGRIDLLESNPKAMFNSLQKLKALPDELIVCPGHNYGKAPTNTLGDEKVTNSTLLSNSVTDWETN
ncbi:MAG: MBL fold metallo-hydrolase [Candidatus Riflebacteria bacterium]|nr:MBL fold metallo-hydrolase [Candidatus Riflebacteria bacterium]